MLSKDIIDNQVHPKYYGEYYQQLKYYNNKEFAKQSLKTIYDNIKCQIDKPQTLFTENPEIIKNDKEDKDDEKERGNKKNEEDHEIRQRRFLKKKKIGQTQYNPEMDLYNSEEELSCKPDFIGRHDKFDFGQKVNFLPVEENKMPFTIPFMYEKLFENPKLKYECEDEQNNKVPKPQPGFGKDSNDDDLEVQMISRTKRIIFFNIYHEFLEICVADKKANVNSYWVLDRSYKGHYYNSKELIGNRYDTFQRIIYVAGYQGTKCDISNFVSRRDHPDKPCIAIHTTYFKKKIRFMDIIQRAFDYGLAYPKYGKVNTHCQHFAKNLYQEITNVDLTYSNGQLMKKSNSGWYKKMKKRFFPNWYFESMKKLSNKNFNQNKFIN